MTSRPDPLQLPETGGEYLLAPATRVWLTWSGISIVVAVAAAVIAGIALPNLEAAIVTFGLGMAYSAATPRILRIASRRLRG